jgi:hypothetical protein
VRAQREVRRAVEKAATSVISEKTLNHHEENIARIKTIKDVCGGTSVGDEECGIRHYKESNLCYKSGRKRF